MNDININENELQAESNKSIINSGSRSSYNINKSANNSHANEEKAYLKYRNEKLNKDLLEKMNNIQLLNEELKSKDYLGVEIAVVNKKFIELQGQMNFIKSENFRLLDIIQNKDNLLSQFKNLVNITSSKFQIFEDMNLNLREENTKLNKKT